MTFSAALASGIGRVIPETPLDLTSLIGKAVQEYRALLAQNGREGASGVRVIERNGVLAGFYLSDAGFSLCGYAVKGREPRDLTENMEASGWTTVQDPLEGGLRFQTFEWAENSSVCTFRLHSSDWVITSVPLEVQE